MTGDNHISILFLKYTLGARYSFTEFFEFWWSTVWNFMFANTSINLMTKQSRPSWIELAWNLGTVCAALRWTRAEVLMKMEVPHYELIGGQTNCCTNDIRGLTCGGVQFSEKNFEPYTLLSLPMAG